MTTTGRYRLLLQTTPAVIELLRPYNSSTTFLGLIAGWALAGQPFALAPLATAAGILLLIHSAANLENDRQDAAVDRLNHRTGPLLDGRLSDDTARTIVIALSSLALVIAVKAPTYQWLHTGFALALIAASWTYNNRPLQLSRRPIASIALLALCYGLLPIAYGYVLAGGQMNAAALAILLAWTAGRAGLSILKDFKDAAGDNQAGKRTFFLAYGRATTVSTSIVLGGGSALIWFVYAGYHPAAGNLQWWLCGSLIGTFVRLAWLRYQLSTARHNRHLNQLFHRSLLAHIVFEGLLTAWLINS